ncbi:hypothetical protein BV22DRAFT_552285 [Leucogyrophana mollusca]|uniref:Uncharacterized protein n=1 Tax=Leucogyrophana mollusca TaxID=85980 RepID=A0ACB8BDK6_9AGAM|nr:hypothetical protein BV22DRAFT_552285 [Leucogyrophana mollusca]
MSTHSCLLIPEIILEIFEYVFLSKNGWADIAALARTCRAFSPPALDILWRTQWSLAPLVRCLPDHTLELSNNLESSATIVRLADIRNESDWERLFLYASRIRTIQRDRQSWNIDAYKLHPSVLHKLLSACPRPSLLPNLRSLEYGVLSETDNNSLSSLQMLLNRSSVRELSFTIPEDISFSRSESLMAAFPEHCTFLEDLTVTAELAILLHPSTVNVFASMRHLRTLSLYSAGDRQDFVELPLNLPPQAFPSLLELHMRNLPSTYSLALIRSICSDHLKTVSLSLLNGDAASMLLDLCKALQSKSSWTASLQSLSITGQSLSATGAHAIAAPHGGNIPQSTLRLLLPFSNLRHLDLGIKALSINDDIIHDMAKAWPRLQQLCIWGRVPSHTAIPTLGGLVPLAIHCPYLSSLTLKINAVDVVSPTALPSTPSESTVLSNEQRPAQTMEFTVDAQSPITDPAKVADFLLSIFPKVDVRPVGDIWGAEQIALWGKVSTRVHHALGLPSPPRLIRSRNTVFHLWN